MSLSLSSVHCCGELHTISASVCCCPGNRDTKNRSIFFTPDISGAQSYCFNWHHAFSHPFNWPLAYILEWCICTVVPGCTDWSFQLDTKQQPMHREQLQRPHLCSTAISFSILFSLPSNAFLGMHLMATSLWVLFSSARTTSEKAPLKHTQAYMHQSDSNWETCGLKRTKSESFVPRCLESVTWKNNTWKVVFCFVFLTKHSCL